MKMLICLELIMPRQLFRRAKQLKTKIVLVITSALADRQATFQRLRLEFISRKFLTQFVLHILMPFSKVPLIIYTIILNLFGIGVHQKAVL